MSSVRGMGDERDGTSPVVVVTGGGGGIGAAIAEHLGADGWFVVTVDPLVTLDGSEQLPATEETTAGRIVAAGGQARASSASVTDADAVHELFRSLAGERGRLDAVINVAGISRPTSFVRGGDEDWNGVLAVHLDGYRNILAAALPIMEEAGYGRIVGITSGSGWRQADAGSYACAKRAVAGLTWQVGRATPPGVVVNAMSPIAVTRMVTAALGARRGATGGGPTTGGLSLGAMPTPDELGPFAAYLVGDDIGWCSGQVFFAGGPEVAVLEPPRLVEVVRTDGDAPLAERVDAAADRIFAPAERAQASTGGSNPRLVPAPGSSPDPLDMFDSADSDDTIASRPVRSCAVVSDRPDLAGAVARALGTRGIRSVAVPVGMASSIAEAVGTLEAAAPADGTFDAVIVALSDGSDGSDDAITRGGDQVRDDRPGWRSVLDSHAGLVDRIHTDAAWVRAAAGGGPDDGGAVRVVTVVDAASSGGRSRAQAAAQLARSARAATKDRVSAFAISVEKSVPTTSDVVGQLAAHLVSSPGAAELSGAELVVDEGWIGLRRHPHPGTSLAVDADLPPWFGRVLRRIVGPAGATPAPEGP